MSTSYLVLQPLLLNAISIPATAYIVSSLGPLGYGQWAVALSLVASTGILSDLGVRSAFVRKVSRNPEMAQAMFAEQVGVRVLLSAISGGAAVIICAVLKYPATVVHCTLVLACAGMFTSAAGVVADLLVAIDRAASMAIINTIAGLTLTVASVIAIWLGAGPLGLAMAYLLGPVLTGALSLTLVHRQLFAVGIAWNLGRFWVLLKESKVLALQLFVGGLDAQAANLIVPKLVNISSYGYFAAGTLLPTRLMVIPDGLVTVFYPVLSRAHAEGPQAFRSSVKRFFFFAAAASFGAAIPVFILSGPIARLLFPAQPEICQTVIRITIWMLPLTTLAVAIGYTVTSAFREFSEAKAAFVGAVLSIPLTFFLITRFGLTGACVSLSARALLLLVLRLPLLSGALRERTGHADRAARPAELTPEEQHGN